MSGLIEARRARFEAWFLREVWRDGCYGNPDILRRQLWPCWNAAINSVVVELPEINDYLDTYAQGDNRDDYLIALHDAIEAAGVRTK